MASDNLVQIRDLRAQAKSHIDAARILNEAADKLESLYGITRPVPSHRFYGGGVAVPMPSKGPLSADDIKSILRLGKSLRAYELTKMFGCTTSEVNAIVENPQNGLYVAHRGWIKEKTPPIPLPEVEV